MPSQADLTKPQKLELLTYHRVKQKREARCPQCKEEAEKYVQTCYWCRQQFTDKDGVIADDAEALSMLQGALGAALTDEQKAEAHKKRAEALKKRGVVTTKGGVKREDWEAFKAKRLKPK